MLLEFEWLKLKGTESMTLGEVKGAGINRSLGYAFTVKAEKDPASLLRYLTLGRFQGNWFPGTRHHLAWLSEYLFGFSSRLFTVKAEIRQRRTM